MDLPELLEKYWLPLVGAAGATWGGFTKVAEWRSKKNKEKVEASAAEQVARLDLTRFAQEAVASANKVLSDQVDRQASRIEEQDVLIRALNDKVNEVLQEYATMVGLKDAELAIARGRVRELEAEVSTLKRALSANGIAIPLMFKAHEVVDHKLKPMGSSDDASVE